jgi:hypothetical protein
LVKASQDSKGLSVPFEAVAHTSPPKLTVEHLLPDMPERRVTEVVSEPSSFARDRIDSPVLKNGPRSAYFSFLILDLRESTIS